jgi:heptosyltransferase-3
MKFLLVKLNHIGDTLIMTPTIKYIKENFPNSTIDVVVRKGCEGVLEDNEYIDNIITIARPEKNKRNLKDSFKEFLSLFKKVFFKRYDYAFDLSNSDRAKFIILLSFAKRRGINAWHAKLGLKKYLFTDFSYYAWGKNHQVYKDFKTVQDILKKNGEPGHLYINIKNVNKNVLKRFEIESKKYIIIHPTSRWSYKEWQIDKWREVIKYLKNSNFEILITCGPDKKEIEKVKKIADGLNVKITEGKTTLRELAFLIKNAEFFIGVDTAAMHIAAAVQTPVIALFGPSDEWSWYPWKVKHKLVLGNCVCKLTRNFICDKSKLLPCMDSIKVDDVINAIKDLENEYNFHSK